MKILFDTNLDNYNLSSFPENLTYVPRVGEVVMVREELIKYYLDKKLPITLEVVKVTHTESGVVCELWYSKIDLERATQNKINLF